MTIRTQSYNHLCTQHLTMTNRENKVSISTRLLSQKGILYGSFKLKPFHWSNLVISTCMVITIAVTAASSHNLTTTLQNKTPLFCEQTPITLRPRNPIHEYENSLTKQFEGSTMENDIWLTWLNWYNVLSHSWYCAMEFVIVKT